MELSTSIALLADLVAVERIVAMMLRTRCCSSASSTSWCSTAACAVEGSHSFKAAILPIAPQSSLLYM